MNFQTSVRTSVRPYVRPPSRGPSQAPISPLRPQISPLRPQVSPLRPKITPLRPKISPFRSKISSLKPKISPLRYYISLIRPKINYFKPKIRPLKPKIGLNSALKMTLSGSNLPSSLISLLFSNQSTQSLNVLSQDVWKFTPVSYRTSALWGRCPAPTQLLQLITPSRASGTADHVQSLDD